MKPVRLVLGLLVAGALALSPREAPASVSLAVTFDALVLASDAVALATPVEEHAVMEDGKIFTYTRLHVDSGVAGDAATGGDVTVRAFGGVVNHIGMVSEGEPSFTVGKQQLLFLRHPTRDGTPTGPKNIGLYNVTGDAQGQFVILKDDKTQEQRFRRSRTVGMLMQPRNPTAAADKAGQASSQSVRIVATSVLATDMIENRATVDVVRDVAAAFRKLHATH